MKSLTLKGILTAQCILLFISVMGQITSATNGLNVVSSAVGLGGTLNNAQTAIDFGSSNSSSNLLIKKGTSNYFSITNGGSVGVGTSSPLTTFNVNGTARVDGSSYVIGSANSSVFYVQKSSIGINVFAEFTDLTGGGFIRFRGAASNGFYPNMALKPDGTIQNSSGITAYSNDVGNTTAALRLEARLMGDAGPLVNKNILEVGSYTNTYISVRANGSLGIGTTAPTAYLQIKAGTATANTAPLKFTSGTLLTTTEAGAIEYDGSHLYFTATNGGTRSQLDQQSGGGTNYWTLSGTNISTNTSGNVGIGTSSPGPYKLAVEGTIGARKIKVTQANPWADYVFDKDYMLLSLDDVEKYVQQYKHLPEVPTSKEVEKDGLDIGDNQAVLLKKIEELTLYVIDLNKKVEKLSDENAELRKRIKK